jgi:hypothetical protein
MVTEASRIPRVYTNVPWTGERKRSGEHLCSLAGSRHIGGP